MENEFESNIQIITHLDPWEQNFRLEDCIVLSTLLPFYQKYQLSKSKCGYFEY